VYTLRYNKSSAAYEIQSIRWEQKNKQAVDELCFK